MNRGMKKWAPYKSLNEQADYIHKMLYEKNKISRPIISNDEAENINDILINYHGQILTIEYFDDGYIYKINAPLYKIDSLNHRLYLDRISYLDFHDLVSLTNYD